MILEVHDSSVQAVKKEILLGHFTKESLQQNTLVQNADLKDQTKWQTSSSYYKFALKAQK